MPGRFRNIMFEWIWSKLACWIRVKPSLSTSSRSLGRNDSERLLLRHGSDLSINKNNIRRRTILERQLSTGRMTIENRLRAGTHCSSKEDITETFKVENPLAGRR